MNEDTPSSISVGDMETPVTLKNVTPDGSEKKACCYVRDPTRITGLKEGAAGAVSKNPL
jgi:hypothetical protein